MGSCVLTDKNHILTAAHIFIESDFRQDTLKLNGQTVIVNQPMNERVGDIQRYCLKFKGKKIQAEKLMIHPDYLLQRFKGPGDLAVVTLKDSITGIKPAVLNSEFDETGSKVVGVGYGANGIANDPKSVKQRGEKIAGENVIDSIGGENYLGKSAQLFCDFDCLNNKSCNKFGSPVPMGLEYLCSGGDSGGGLFRKKSDSWQLVGICSDSYTDIQQLMMTGYYGQIMGWARVSVFADWIKEKVK
jgi:hypothetical protein